jgi:GNAT superfamily N-acetyltransferase
VVLRLVERADQLGPVSFLSSEFAQWARGRVRAEYGIDVEAEDAEDLFSDLDRPPESRARLYLAEVNDEPVGMGGLRPLGAYEAEIKRMYVRPSSRGLGVGRVILERFIDDARTLGYKTIHLDSAPFMHEAHALYRSFGFVPSTPHRGWELEDVAAVRDVPWVFMSLDLSTD